MEEKKENLFIKEEMVEIMKDENKSVEINEEVRNMVTNTNFDNVGQEKDTELNYVSSVSIDGSNNNVPSAPIISQEEFGNKHYSIFGEDMEEDLDFGDDEDWSVFNNTWNEIENMSQVLSQDNKIYIGEFLETVITKSKKGDMFMLEKIFNVEDGGEMKKIKYITVFPKYNSGYRFHEVKRLIENLMALGITRDMIHGDISPRNIANALQPLVGRKIKISQYKQDGYNKYKIHGLVRGEN